MRPASSPNLDMVTSMAAADIAAVASPMSFADTVCPAIIQNKKLNTDAIPVFSIRAIELR